jgi:hypothetical protein
VTRSSPTTLLWPKAGAERCWRARSAALGGAGRCGLKFGWAAAFPGQRARARAPTRPKEESEVVCWLGMLAEGRAWRGAAMVADLLGTHTRGGGGEVAFK